MNDIVKLEAQPNLAPKEKVNESRKKFGNDLIEAGYTILNRPGFRGGRLV